VSLVMLVVHLVLALHLRQDHAELQAWTASTEHMEHSVLVRNHAVVEREHEHVNATAQLHQVAAQHV